MVVIIVIINDRHWIDETIGGIIISFILNKIYTKQKSLLPLEEKVMLTSYVVLADVPRERYRSSMFYHVLSRTSCLFSTLPSRAVFFL